MVAAGFSAAALGAAGVPPPGPLAVSKCFSPATTPTEDQAVLYVQAVEVAYDAPVLASEAAVPNVVPPLKEALPTLQKADQPLVVLSADAASDLPAVQKASEFPSNEETMEKHLPWAPRPKPLCGVGIGVKVFLKARSSLPHEQVKMAPVAMAFLRKDKVWLRKATSKALSMKRLGFLHGEGPTLGHRDAALSELGKRLKETDPVLGFDTIEEAPALTTAGTVSARTQNASAFATALTTKQLRSCVDDDST